MNAFASARRIGLLLEADGIEYAIGGALALGVWGVPRATKDVDLSVFVDPDRIDGVSDVYERAGVMFEREAASKAVARSGLFRGLLGRIAIDTFISLHPHFLEMQQRRRRVQTPDGEFLYFISAEDLVVMKLVFGREKDVVDLERLFSVRQLDVTYVRSWLAKMPVPATRVEILDDLARRFPS